MIPKPEMRRKDRAVTKPEDILRIVDKAKILHLGLFDEGCPYVVPLHFGYETAQEGFIFYIHCAKEGHKLDLKGKNPNVCVEMDCDAEIIPAGEDPCRYGAAFASFIGRGKAELVEDTEEKIRGLGLLMENQTGRKFAIDAGMAEKVAIIRITVPEFTAKERKQN